MLAELERRKSLPKFVLDDYCFSWDAHYHFLGHPMFDTDPTYLGHFVNDAAKPTADPNSHDVYVAVSMSKMNCVFEDLQRLTVAVVASRDIKAGEELFVSYGLGYWSTRVQAK